MKRVSLIAASNVIFLSILLVLIFISCGERTATVTTVFTVSEDTTQYLPTTTENSYSIAALGPGEKISFTPTYLKVELITVRINTDPLFCTGSMNGDSPHILVVANPYFEGQENQDLDSFELIGKSAFENLASFSGTADEMHFTEYQSILVNSPDATISGDINVGGTQYTFDNLKEDFGTTIAGPLGSCIAMSQPILIDEEHNPTIYVIFDVENCATLSDTTARDGWPVPGYTDIYVDLNHLLFTLYAAEGEPVVDKYEVVLDSDVFGDHTTWYIKVLTVSNPDGNLADVRWHTVFREGYNGDTWDPDHLVYPLITNVEESTYSIKSNPEWYPDIPLEFPAFKLEDHAGTLIYDGDNYTYTATKR